MVLPLELVLAQWWTRFFLSGCLLVSVDAVRVGLLAPIRVGTLLHYLAAGVAACAVLSLLGACLAVVAALSFRPFAPRFARLDDASRHIFAGALLGLLVGIGVLLLLAPWELRGPRMRLEVPLPAAFATGGVVFGLVLHGALRARAWLLFVPLAMALAVADAQVYPGLYVRFHNVAFLLAWLSLSVATLGMRSLVAPSAHAPRVSPRALLAVALCVALVSQVAAWLPLDAVRLTANRAGMAVPKLLTWLAFTVDLDRDAYSALAGGGDCNDLDDAVHPGTCELPGNGVDENCNGLVDGAEPTEARHATRPLAQLPDVYFVLLDAVRADLGGLRPAEGEFPALERLHAESLVFDSAYTPYPGTYYAMRAMNESRAYRDTSDEGGTLLRGLLAAGYDVRMGIATERYRVTPAQPLLGEDRSTGDPFSLPGSGKLEWTARLVDETIAELSDETPGRPPRFRWVHILDAHAPRLRDAAGDSPVATYRREVRHALGQLDRLLQALSASPRYADTVVIVASDHGESFGEHGGSHHGSELYEEQTRIVFSMRLPGRAPAHVTAAASLLDVLPTLAAHLGVAPEASWQGRNWLAADLLEPVPRVLSGVQPVDDWAGLGRAAAEMVSDGRWKLIFNITHNTSELYDLRSDPGELQNRLADAPAEALRLRAVLHRWQDRSACRMDP